MKSYRLENGKYLGVSYFTNVKNIAWLKKNISSVFKEKSPVLICRKLIVHPFQIVVAANSAYLSNENSSMITKSLATEILFYLSASKNISKSLMDMSVKDEDDEMIIAIVSKFVEVPEMKIFYTECVQGDEVDVSKLTEDIDIPTIQSYYGINHIESETSSLLDSIVTRIACKMVT